MNLKSILLTFLSLFLLVSPPTRALENIPCDPKAESFNYNDFGIITPIKNQGGFGACVAFAWVSVIESLYAARYSVLKDFSEQNLYNCTPDSGKFGGSWPWYAASALEGIGLVPESLQPYIEKKSAFKACKKFNSSSYLKGIITRKIGEFFLDEEFTKETLCSRGPLFTTATVSDSWRSLYSSREPIGDFKSSVPLPAAGTHAVSIIGWTKDGWIIKNSWGTHWGNNGFGVIKYGYNNIGAATYFAELAK